jgi:hypothetical protein
LTASNSFLKNKNEIYLLKTHFGNILNWREERKGSITFRFLAQETGWRVMIFTKKEGTGRETGMCKTKPSVNSIPITPVPVTQPSAKLMLPISALRHFTFLTGCPWRTISYNCNTNNI